MPSCRHAFELTLWIGRTITSHRCTLCGAIVPEPAMDAELARSALRASRSKA